MKLDLVKFKNSLRVGTDDMLTVTSIAQGLGRYEVWLVDRVVVVKHTRLGTYSYSPIENVIYYSGADVDALYRKEVTPKPEKRVVNI